MYAQTINTGKSVYYTANEIDKVLIFGMIPSDLPICDSVPAPSGGFMCDPPGSGPSIEVLDPNSLQKSTISYVPGFNDDVFKIVDTCYATYSWQGNFVSFPGIYTARLWSGNGATGTILASTTFEILAGTGSGSATLDFATIDPCNPVTPSTNATTILSKMANATNIQIGDAVLFTYNQTNDGTVQLDNVSVSDDLCSPVVPVTNGTNNIGDMNVNDLLDPGESWQFQCVHIFNTNGTFTNTAIGNATDNLGNFITYPADPDEIANATVTVVPEFDTIAIMILGTTASFAFVLQRLKKLPFLN